MIQLVVDYPTSDTAWPKGKKGSAASDRDG